MQPPVCYRSNARQKGATLVLVIASLFILVLVGIGVFCLVELFGGARELQHLTDSGSLNLGKQLVTTGVPLNTASEQVSYQFMWYPYWDVRNRFPSGTWATPFTTTVTLSNGVEGSSFAYLTDSNGNINLANYNRVIAQTMLIGWNALDENTLPAAANAQTLWDHVQVMSNSLSDRLATKLADPNIAAPIFMYTAAGNSLRMLGSGLSPTFQSSNYQISYNSPGASTNVWLDTSILPQGLTVPSGALSSTLSTTNFPYLTGYTSIDTGPFSIQGAPVFPGRQPHLISERDFTADKTSPITSGYVPPNSFGSQCLSPEHISNKQLMVSSASVVGILGQEYPAAIPEGYIVIHNTIGSLNGPLPSLITGISAAEQALVMKGLCQRLRQIAPNISDTQMMTYLNNLYIPGNPTGAYQAPVYVYLYPDPSNRLYAAWHAQIVAAGQPNGTPGQVYASTVPPPTFLSQGINAPYGMVPDGTLTRHFASNYEVDWTPSSGFENLLGLLIIP